MLGKKQTRENLNNWKCEANLISGKLFNAMEIIFDFNTKFGSTPHIDVNRKIVAHNNGFM